MMSLLLADDSDSRVTLFKLCNLHALFADGAAGRAVEMMLPS
jgi:hypothetical protein